MTKISEGRLSRSACNKPPARGGRPAGAQVVSVPPPLGSLEISHPSPGPEAEGIVSNYISRHISDSQGSFQKAAVNLSSEREKRGWWHLITGKVWGGIAR